MGGLAPAKVRRAALIGFEYVDEGQRSQLKLASLDFEVACLGHGKTTVSKASERIRRAFKR
jgi:hypothetical protein